MMWVEGGLMQVEVVERVNSDGWRCREGSCGRCGS